MSASDAVRQRIALVSGAGGAKRHLMHPFNGRFHPIDHGALDDLIDAMVSRIDVTAVDYVLGFPEGGAVPAYAFGRAVGRPVILASRLPLDLPDRVEFEQPQANLGTTQYVYVVPYLLASDVLLSDASSVIFEFLALDRPIVLVTNPRHRADLAWLDDDIVWRWRDLGHEIGDVGELPGAVAVALGDPGARGERRRSYAQTLFGRFTDGRNAERAAEHVLLPGTCKVYAAARTAHAPSIRSTLPVDAL